METEHLNYDAAIEALKIAEETAHNGTPQALSQARAFLDRLAQQDYALHLAANRENEAREARERISTEQDATLAEMIREYTGLPATSKIGA